MENKSRKTLRAVLIALGALVAALSLLLGGYLLWERSPEPAAPPQESPAPVVSAARPPKAEPTPEPMPEGLPPDTQRLDGMYTLILAGRDEASGNTDVILVARLDARRHTLNVISIPRDTIINTDWVIRKINSVYIGAINADGDGLESLRWQIRRLVGFSADNVAVLSLDVFMELIDTLGGVDFDVPNAIDYDDYSQNLFIHLQPGMQHLNGYQAMGLCRFRADYITGDLGRIEIQQDFMKACADQFIRLGNIPNAAAAASLLAENLHTDLSAANIAWFMRQALKCSSENVHFSIMPFDEATLQGYCYAIPRLWDWLPMINEQLDPYEDPVGYGHLDLVYRTDEGYAATGGLQGAWYFEPPPEPTPEPVSEEPEAPSAPEDEPESTPGPTIIEVILPPSDEEESGETE